MTAIEIKFEKDLPFVDALLALSEYDHIDRLTIDGVPDDKVFTTEVSRLLLRSVKSIGMLSIMANTTRTALRDCFALPNLHTLEVWELTVPGKVVDTSKAVNLRTLTSYFPTETDFKIFMRLPHLTTFNTSSQHWTPDIAERLFEKLTLHTLETECSNIDDEITQVISREKAITQLGLGLSNITGKGLAHIANMSQLKRLDIWGTSISDEDLHVLCQLENLTHLEIGGYSDQTYLTEAVIPTLMAIPNLKTVRLREILISDDDLQHLKAHFERVEYNSILKVYGRKNDKRKNTH